MSHLILLGDSIFDNAAYVAGGPDVVQQVRARLPQGWTASLRAVDGSVTEAQCLELANRLVDEKDTESLPVQELLELLSILKGLESKSTK